MTARKTKTADYGTPIGTQFRVLREQYEADDVVSTDIFSFSETAFIFQQRPAPVRAGIVDEVTHSLEHRL